MELKDNFKDDIKKNDIIPSHSLKGKSVKRRVESQLKNDENFFSNFLHTIKKINRSSQEIEIISSFLKSLENFYKIIESAHSNREELTQKIAFALKHQFYEANSLVFRTGDKGDKFYVILKGKVNILIAQDVNMMMSEEEYMIYLAKLKVNNEIELFNRCIMNNKSSYPLSSDCFENDYMVTVFKNKRGIRKNSFISSQLKEFGEKLNNSESVETTKFDFCERYIKELEPFLFPYVKIDRKEVTVWKYHKVLSLSTGEFFGEVALQSYLNKRTATVITEEDTHFGSIDRADYDNCLKQVTEKQNKVYINMLLNHKLFELMPYGIFTKKCFNMFVNEEINMYDSLFKENEEIKNIYFICTGEFELSMKKSFNEINDLIKYLGGEPKNLKLEAKDDYDKNKLNQFMNEKKLTKISIVKSKDFLGLEDIINEGKYVLSATCLVKKGEVMKVERHFFYKMFEREKGLIKSYDNVINEKKKFLIKRLRFILETRATLFINKHKSRSILEFSEKGSKAFNKIELINPNYVIKASRNNLFITNSIVVSSNGVKSSSMPSVINSWIQTVPDRNEFNKIFTAGSTEFNNNFFLTTDRVSKSVDKSKLLDTKINTYRSKEVDRYSSVSTLRENDRFKPNNLNQSSSNKRIIIKYNLNHNNNAIKKDVKTQSHFAFNKEGLKDHKSRNLSTISMRKSMSDFSGQTNNFLKKSYISQKEFNLLRENESKKGFIKGKKLNMKNIMQNIEYKRNVFESINKSLKFSNSMIFVKTGLYTNR